MIRWNVRERAKKNGWTTPYRLAAETGISQPAAKRVLAGAELSRIEVPALEKLRVAFGLETPWSLLKFEK